MLNQNSNKTKILGLGQNKKKYTLSVVIVSFNDKKATKSNILSNLASAFCPFNKITIQRMFELKIPWDKVMPRQLNENGIDAKKI